MTIQSSDNLIPLHNFKIDAVDGCEKTPEQQAFIKAVAQGLKDIEEGRTKPLSEVKQRLFSAKK